MANLPIKDGANADKYLKSTGAGSDLDPFIPEHFDPNVATVLTRLGSAGDAANPGGSLHAKLRSLAENFVNNFYAQFGDISDAADITGTFYAKLRAIAARLPSALGFVSPSAAFPVLFARPEPSAIATAYNAVVITTVTAQSDQDPVKIDLNGLNHQGVFNIGIQIATSGSASPGSARTFSLFYAFSPNDLTIASDNVPTRLNTREFSRVCDLPDVNNTTREYETQQVQQLGRYLYLWYDYSIRTAGSTITVTVRVVAL